jgi:hypothetical protein
MVLTAVGYAAAAFHGTRALPRWVSRWLLLALILMGAMMFKPTPRYYEVPMLAGAALACLGVASLRWRWITVAGLALSFHAAYLYPKYFHDAVIDQDQRLLFFKDSSRDFLDKQSLVSVLGGSGCRLSDIKFVDHRVWLPLSALTLGDWPVRGERCLWRGLHISRRAEVPPHAEGEEAAGFVLWEN